MATIATWVVGAALPLVLALRPLGQTTQVWVNAIISVFHYLLVGFGVGLPVGVLSIQLASDRYSGTTVSDLVLGRPLRRSFALGGYALLLGTAFALAAGQPHVAWLSRVVSSVSTCVALSLLAIVGAGAIGAIFTRVVVPSIDPKRFRARLLVRAKRTVTKLSGALRREVGTVGFSALQEWRTEEANDFECILHELEVLGRKAVQESDRRTALDVIVGIGEIWSAYAYVRTQINSAWHLAKLATADELRNFLRREHREDWEPLLMHHVERQDTWVDQRLARAVDALLIQSESAGEVELAMAGLEQLVLAATLDGAARKVSVPLLVARIGVLSGTCADQISVWFEQLLDGWSGSHQDDARSLARGVTEEAFAGRTPLVRAVAQDLLRRLISTPPVADVVVEFWAERYDDGDLDRLVEVMGAIHQQIDDLEPILRRKVRALIDRDGSCLIGPAPKRMMAMYLLWLTVTSGSARGLFTAPALHEIATDASDLVVAAQRNLMGRFHDEQRREVLSDVVTEVGSELSLAQGSVRP